MCGILCREGEYSLNEFGAAPTARLFDSTYYEEC